MTTNSRLRTARGLPGIPEWEAAKASSRPLAHYQAVAECAELSNLFRRLCNHMATITVDFDKILQTLRAKKIPP